jgi:hypothetical protein
MSHPPHLSFHDTNNIWWTIQIMELLLRYEYSERATAQSTAVTARYMKVSVSSSGSKHYKPCMGQINTENCDLDRSK